MSAVLGLFQALIATIFGALTTVVKTVLLSAALLISLFFGAILIIIHMLR
jgi:hypothetical protein